MPKRIDVELKARAVRLVNGHHGEYSSLTAAAAVVAKQLGVGKESVRHWVIQSQIDGGQRLRATSEELAEIKALKAENRRLREDVEILRSNNFLRRGTRPPQPLIMGIIDTMRSQGIAVESDLSGAAPAGLSDRRADPTGPGSAQDESSRPGPCPMLTSSTRYVTSPGQPRPIRPSIGSVGDAYDKRALMDSINGLYKAERIRTMVFHDGPYQTVADVEYATAGGSTGTTTEGPTRP